MDIKIRVQFEFSVPLTDDDVSALIALSEHHYDGTCQQAGKEGGFLQRWKATIESWGTEEEYPTWARTLRTSFYELDLCLKIMERPTVIEDNPVYVAAVKNMRNSFRGATALASRNYDNWQATYSSDPPTEDPSMEEILASIRRILAEEGERPEGDL